MSQELAKIERSVKPDQRLAVEDVKRYLCPKASDQELFLFVQLCQSQGLDPWRKEAYLIKYDERSPASIVVGKDLFTRRAQANNKFAGFKSGIIAYRKDPDVEGAKWEEVYIDGSYKRPSDKLAGGWAEVFLKGYKNPIKVTVSLEEYNRNQAMWNKMPCTMIRKVALVQALREAFPEELGGLVDESEVAIKEDPQAQQEGGPVTPILKEEEDCEAANG